MAFGRGLRVVGSRFSLVRTASLMLRNGAARKPTARNALQRHEEFVPPLGRRRLRRWPGIHREASDDSVLEKEGAKKRAGFSRNKALLLFLPLWRRRGSCGPLVTLRLKRPEARLSLRCEKTPRGTPKLTVHVNVLYCC